MVGHLSSLVSRTVHSTGTNNLGEPTVYEGEIIAAWIEDGDDTVRVAILCRDNRYRVTWLGNCVDGPAPRDDK